MDSKPLTLMQALIIVVQQERKRQGMSQKDLAAKAGLHPVAISKMVKGLSADMRIGTLEALADALTQDPLHPIRGSTLLQRAQDFLELVPKIPPPPAGFAAADYYEGVLAGREAVQAREGAPGAQVVPSALVREPDVGRLTLEVSREWVKEGTG
jgi:transcriptional regulator with XRE-family HTH domain